MAMLINKTELLNRIRAGHASFEAMLATLTPVQLIQPGAVGSWSVKDVIAHLIVHEQFALRELNDAQRKQEKRYDYSNNDQINAQAVAVSQKLSYDEVKADWDRSYHQVLAIIEALAETDFALGSQLELRLGDTIDGAFGNNTYEHYAEHEAEISLRLFNSD